MLKLLPQDIRITGLGAFIAIVALQSIGSAGDMSAARRGADYVVSRQLGNGAFFSENNPADGVAEALASIAAVGASRTSIDSALLYLEDRGPERASQKGAYAARIIMGLVAADTNPQSFGSFDYVSLLDSHYDPKSGAYDTSTVYADALALLGVSASGKQPPTKAVEYLRRHECPGGGFSHQVNCTMLPDTDTTGVTLNALMASGVGRNDPIIVRTLSFLRSAQNDDGGFGALPYSLDHPTNANSTALVISGIVSAGEDPITWKKSQHNPITALLELQMPSGGFKYTTEQNQGQDYATVQAIPGVAALAYPLQGRSIHAASPISDSPVLAREVEPAPVAAPRGRSKGENPNPVAAKPPLDDTGTHPSRTKPKSSVSWLKAPWLVSFMALFLVLPPILLWRKRLR